jgi:hypothetical protein
LFVVVCFVLFLRKIEIFINNRYQRVVYISATENFVEVQVYSSREIKKKILNTKFSI